LTPFFAVVVDIVGITCLVFGDHWRCSCGFVAICTIVVHCCNCQIFGLCFCLVYECHFSFLVVGVGVGGQSFVAAFMFVVSIVVNCNIDIMDVCLV